MRKSYEAAYELMICVLAIVASGVIIVLDSIAIFAIIIEYLMWAMLVIVLSIGGYAEYCEWRKKRNNKTKENGL